MRSLHLVLGDQLDPASAIFDGFDPRRDRLWMAEVAEEATHVWCHQLRIAFFFAAMRHFRDEQRELGRTVEYHELNTTPDLDRGGSFAEVLWADVGRLKPERLVVVDPGDWRVREQLQQAADRSGLTLELREDRHFYCTRRDVEEYGRGRKRLVLEYFYRDLRRRHGVLVDEAGQPAGGQWNFDQENRDAFPASGPVNLPQRLSFPADATSRMVIELVRTRFADHPGSLEHWSLPVTREDALRFLRHFIDQILPSFGRWEDAMWRTEPFLYHSRLSALLNVKLLNPRECVEAAVAAGERGVAPLNSVEGFVRQILGWREFVRLIYWRNMPGYAAANALDHHEDLPGCYWNGRTEMQCIHGSMQHVLDHGYTHHIERLMVLGNFALLLGVHPRQFHEWHMAMYLDAIDWVSLPNTLGMSQYGDGGIVGTKPYCASGNYIRQMSNYCRGCRFDPGKATGEHACPVTTLYWDFLSRHADRFRDNARMKFQLANLRRKSPQELAKIRAEANSVRNRIRNGEL
jgi:deoxyribodipyrimidine photolyase-related protein